MNLACDKLLEEWNGFQYNNFQVDHIWWSLCEHGLAATPTQYSPIIIMFISYSPEQINVIIFSPLPAYHMQSSV